MSRWKEQENSSCMFIAKADLILMNTVRKEKLRWGVVYASRARKLVQGERHGQKQGINNHACGVVRVRLNNFWT